MKGCFTFYPLFCGLFWNPVCRGTIVGCLKKGNTKCEERKNQQDATVRCLLSTSVSTCFEHHYAHLQENKDRVTAYGALLWFCWMWLVQVPVPVPTTSSRTTAVHHMQ